MVPTGWQVSDVRDTGISVIDGDRGKHYPTKAELNVAGFCLFLNTGNIKNDAFNFSNCDFITENKDARLNKGKLRRHDIVLTTRGTVGSVAYYNDGIWFDEIRINSGMVILRAKKGIVAPYLYHLLKSPLLKTQYKLYSSGSAQPQLPIKDLLRIKLPLPKPAIQRKIAAILTTYDDLIEVNKRRIALLEKIAEEIYREWFVRMRFPGHQDTRFVKGAPEGWPFDLGSAFFDHVKGKSYSSHEISDEDGACFFITLKSFHRRGGYRKEGLKYFSGSYKEGQCVDTGDVVMAVTDMTQDRAVVGEVARIPKLTGKRAIISLDVIRLIPKEMSSTFLYAYMRHSGFANYIKEFANGANVLHLKPDLVGKQRLLFPPEHLREKFADLVEPIYQEVNALEEANAVLTTTRDLLLPRLISGKLSVEDLDIQLPPSMQEASPADEVEPEVSHA